MAGEFPSRRWPWAWRRSAGSGRPNAPSNGNSLGRRSGEVSDGPVQAGGCSGNAGRTDRLLVYQAAWLADQNNVRFTRESSMAKLFASEVAVRVANECVQVYGGYGIYQGLSREVLSRREAVYDWRAGNERDSELVIARQLLRPRNNRAMPSALPRAHAKACGSAD